MMKNKGRGMRVDSRIPLNLCWGIPRMPLRKTKAQFFSFF